VFVFMMCVNAGLLGGPARFNGWQDISC